MPDKSELRPRVFIGSSGEGHDIAEAIQANLDRACEVTIWSQGVFGLSGGTLETLVDKLESFDFAVLVLSPDDLTLSRDALAQSPRDNVLLELGLFIGSIGRERTFVVFDRSKELKIPSDLAGVTAATFQMHSDGNRQASVGAATTQIKVAIQTNGRRQQKISAEVDPTTHFQIIHGLLEKAPEQFLIWMHENNQPIRRESRLFGTGVRYVYSMRDGSAGQGNFSMDGLCEKLPDADLLTVDLRNNVSLTQRGIQYVRWLTDNGHRATYFKSDVGGWGQPDKGALEWPPNWPSPFMRPEVPPSESQPEQKADQ